MKKQVRLKIWGIVQGVSFRYYIQILAKKLDLKGFIRNDLKGTVSIEAEGEKESLEKLIDFCKEGPRGARIEKIDISWQDKIGGYKDFSIRY